MAHHGSLIACHECDLLHRLNRIGKTGTVRCSRCNAVLIKLERKNPDYLLALAITGLILFAMANCFPLLSLKFEGQLVKANLISGVLDLIDHDMWMLAGLVFLTSIAIPLVELTVTLYLFLPLRFNRVPWQTSHIFRFIHSLYPWSMMEVFMLGILVSIVKLGDLATIVPGIALWSFGCLIFILAAINATMNPNMIWEQLGIER